MSLLHYLMQQTVRHRVLRYFHRHGPLERHVTEDMRSWQASGSSESGPVGASRSTSDAQNRVLSVFGVYSVSEVRVEGRRGLGGRFSAALQFLPRL